jgi:hypothetical protein
MTNGMRLKMRVRLSLALCLSQMRIETGLHCRIRKWVSIIYAGVTLNRKGGNHLQKARGGLGTPG